MMKLTPNDSKVCPACRKTFSDPRKKVRFCSTECRKVKRFYGTWCEWCNAELIIPGAKIKETRFCSISCSRGALFIKNNPDFNEDYFSEPNLVNSYWAGFIAADGCVLQTRGRGQLTIKLSAKDTMHLERLQSDIGAGKIYSFTQTLKGSDKEYEMCKYQLYSNKIFSDLGSVFNIHQSKSLNHGPPNLEGDLAYAFIAGYIDGDGSYSHARGKYPVLSVLGTPEFLAWIYLVYEVNRTPKATSTKIHAASFCGGAALEVRESYKNLNLPLLDRKKNRWEDIGLVTDIEDDINVSD